MSQQWNLQLSAFSVSLISYPSLRTTVSQNFWLWTGNIGARHSNSVWVTHIGVDLVIWKNRIWSIVLGEDKEESEEEEGVGRRGGEIFLPYVLQSQDSHFRCHLSELRPSPKNLTSTPLSTLARSKWLFQDLRASCWLSVTQKKGVQNFY